MLSYWEQSSFLNYDLIVIGAGIVGLSVAINLRNKYPKHRILVLERAFMSTGASSRNAGFACMGSPSELLSDLKSSSESEVLNLFEARKRGLEILRQRLGDKTIGYAANGSYEVLGSNYQAIQEQLPYLNQILKPIVKTDSFKIANNKIEQFGFSSSHCKALIENCIEGEIDTGKMLRALIDLAISKGIEIKNNAPVKTIEETNDAVKVCVSDGFRKSEWALKCQKLFVCTNAFSKDFFSELNLTPGRGQVLITEPIERLKFKGVFHYEEGYYYFRVIDNRVLLGGGRNLDFETENTTEIAINKAIQDRLDKLLTEMILPDQPFEIAQRWAGIMAFGPDKQPVVKAFSNRIFGAFRMGGMGVALGSEVARKLVEEIVID